MSRGFSWGKQVEKFPMQEIVVEFVYSRQQKIKTLFVLKDDNSKFLVEVVFVISLYAVATVDFFHSKQ